MQVIRQLGTFLGAVISQKSLECLTHPKLSLAIVSPPLKFLKIYP